MTGMSVTSSNGHSININETRTLESNLQELRACVQRAQALQAQPPLPQGALMAEVARMLTVGRGLVLRQAGASALAALAQDIACLYQSPVKREVDDMLADIARIVVQLHADNALSRWQSTELTLMTEALSVSRSREARQALRCLAQQIDAYDLTSERHWSGQALARIAVALSASGLADTQAVMSHLAQSLRTRADRGENWSPEVMALLASAFGRARGEDERELLSSRAAQIMDMVDRQAMTSEDGWTAQHLAMVIAALANGRGVDVRRARVHTALEIGGRQRTLEEGWSIQDLAMTAQGLHKSGDPDFRGLLARLATEIGERLRTGEETLSRETLLLIDQAFPRLVGQCA